MRNFQKKFFLTFFLTVLTLVVCFFSSANNTLQAATAAELQGKINSINAERQKLLDEIKQYETKLDSTGKQVKNLQEALRVLDLSRSKLLTQLKSTEKGISSTDLSISSIKIDIAEKEEKIDRDVRALYSSIRNIQQSDDVSLIETLLTSGTLSDFWRETEELAHYNIRVQENVHQLQDLKNELSGQKNNLEGKKKNLLSLKSELSDQKKLVEQNQSEKDKLLKTTKNQESNYKTILAEKKKKKEALDAELFAVESELKLAVDFNKLPKFGSGILQWPLDAVRITQTFGDTDFSRTHAGVYNGNGHNGIDFGASVGTPIKAAADGVVVATGNTDIVCAGASYGQWVFIKHNNGLSSLYAHLSLIKTTGGKAVSAGDIIGYSGNTGYSTGPHLHFTVYASDGVKVSSLKSKVCGGTYTIPVADLRAYLNPLLYL